MSRKVFLTVSLFQILNAFSQSSETIISNYIPPSPQAYAMTSFEGQKPSLYTGTANVNIPLYSLNFDGMVVPIGLNYHASGIKTNQEATEVGLGWSLNATAVVSRVIKGKDDFLRLADGHNYNGYVYDESIKPLEEVGYVPHSGTIPPDGSYYKHLVKKKPDTEPDEFSYNFYGYSGRFILSKKSETGGIIRVIKLTEDATRIVFNEEEMSFTIFTPDGFEGTFDVYEKTTSFTAVNATYWPIGYNEVDVTQVINDGGFRGISSWYISRLRSPNGRFLDFEYDIDETGESAYMSLSQPSHGEQSGSAGISQGMLPVYGTLTSTRIVHEHVYLNRISTSYPELTIDFGTSGRTDLKENDWYIQPGTYFPSSRGSLQCYTFIRIRGNSDSGSSLDKIILFKYGNFNSSKFGNTQQRLKLESVQVDDQEYFFSYINPESLPSKRTRGIDHFGYYNGKDDNLLLEGPVHNAATFGQESCADLSQIISTRYYKQREERKPNFEYGKAGLLEKVTYPTKGYTIYNYEPHIYKLTGNETATGSRTYATGGGARIESILDYDADGTLLKKRSYDYEVDGQSTGRLMSPLIHFYYWVYGPDISGNAESCDSNGDGVFDDQDVECYCSFIAVPNTRIPGANAADGKLIGYDRVEETFHSTAEDDPLSYSNIYFFENRPSISLDYGVANERYDALNGQVKLIVNKNSDGQILKAVKYDDYEENLDDILGLVYKVANQFYVYHLSYYQIKRTFIQPKSTTIYESDNGAGLTLNGDVLTVEEGVLMQEQTDEFSEYFMLHSSTFVDSDQRVYKSQYKRIPDYSDDDCEEYDIYCGDNGVFEQYTAQQTYNSRYHIAPVIERLEYVDDQLVTAIGRKYVGEDNRLVLRETYNYNAGQGEYIPSPDGNEFSGGYEQETQITNYNSFRKPLEIIGKDGVINSFIYSSDNLPIVKARGVAYSDLISAYNAVKGNDDFEHAIRTDPRTKDGLIMTYVHNPHVGIARVTDPNGIPTYYEYDFFGRMELVKDYQEKTVEQYEFNFSTPPKTRIMELSETSLDFGGTAIDYPKTLSFTITNAGNTSFTITSTSISGSPFFSTDFAANSIPSGESTVVNITFSPTSKISYSGSIQFSAIDVEGEKLVTFSGSGEDERREMSLSRTSIDFGSVAPVGVEYVNVTNNGNTPLNLYRYETTNAEFNVETTFPRTIEPGKSLQLQLSFVPQGSLQQTGTITIDSNKTDGENEISVTGKRSF